MDVLSESTAIAMISRMWMNPLSPGEVAYVACS